MKIKVKYDGQCLCFKTDAVWFTATRYHLTYHKTHDYWYTYLDTTYWNDTKVNSNMNMMRNEGFVFDFVDKMTAEFFGYTGYSSIQNEMTVVNECHSILKPYKHQQVGSSYLLSRQHSFLIWETGTGKTKTVLDAIETYRREINGCSVLVVAPATLVDMWVYNHVPKNYPDWNIVTDSDDFNKDTMNVLSLSGYSISERLAFIHSFQHTKNLMLVISYDTFSRLGRDENGKLKKLKFDFDVTVFDECHAIKNGKTERTKYIINAFKKTTGKIWMLTGTPTDGKYEEYYSQFSLIHSHPFACERKSEFNTTYGSGRCYKGKWYLDKWISQNAFLLQKEVCLDLPDKTYVTIPITLSQEHMNLYTNFVNTHVLSDLSIEEKVQHLMSDIRFGKTLGIDVTALEQQLVAIQNRTGKSEALAILTYMLYCRMIVAGSSYKIEQNAKIEYLKNTLQQDEKVVIFCNFTATVHQLSQELKDAGFSVATLHGGTVISQRQSIIKDFEEGETNILIANPKVGGQGIDLVASKLCIFFDNDYSYIVRKQAEDRLHRPGQTNKVTYIDLVASGTIDEAISTILAEKQDVVTQTNNAIGNKQLLRKLFFGGK